MKQELIILVFALMGSLGLNAGTGADECLTGWLIAQERVRQLQFEKTVGRVKAKGLSKEGCLKAVIIGVFDDMNLRGVTGAELENDLTDEEMRDILFETRRLYSEALQSFYDCLGEKDSEFKKHVDTDLRKIAKASTVEEKRALITEPDGSYYSEGFIFDLAEREKKRFEAEEEASK